MQSRKSWALAPGWQSRHHLRFQAMPSIQIHGTYLGYGEAYPSRPRVFSSGRMSTRASWPHNLPFCLYLSNTASLDLPLDAGESLPARQPYLSNLLLDEAYPSDTAILNHSRASARVTGTNSLNFSKPPARRGLPIRHGNSETTVGRRREPPGQTNFPFPSCGRQGLPNHAAG